MRLKGKTALVSGAGRNNGRAIALTFAREGADLVLIAQQRGEQLNEVAKACKDLGVQVLPLLGDVGTPEEVTRLVKEGLERFNKIDVLVNVVGIRPHKLPWEFSNEEWLRVFAVNLHSTFYLTNAVAPGMMERRSGSIIALGGKGALTAHIPDAGAVVASKHGLHGLIKTLAHALGPYGVRANLLALSGIENKRLHPEWYPSTGGDAYDSDDLKRTPLRRFGTNQEVANVALFLASDESSYVTGDRIVCGGGRYM